MTMPPRPRRKTDGDGQASKLSADHVLQHKSATIFFSLPFSSSSWRKRFISEGIKPPHLLRQL
jgi:hypothetical protein